jgi:hypothetical protein
MAKITPRVEPVRQATKSEPAKATSTDKSAKRVDVKTGDDFLGRYIKPDGASANACRYR